MVGFDYPLIKKKLSERKSIIITTHKSPDGDALGSSLALFHALSSFHDVSVIVPNEYPHYLKWLPGNNNVLIYEGSEQESDQLIAQSDIIFCLDFNKIYRVDAMELVLKKNQSYKIMIDHHQDPDDFCDQVLSNSNIASTAELIYDFLKAIDYNFNQEIATCLYAGIVTDTGSFKYSGVTSKTHEIVSYLMSFNINHTRIHNNLFDNQNKSRVDLLRVCLNNLELIEEKTTAIIFLKEKDLIELNYQKGDTEGFVNFPLSLKNISVSIFLVEFKDGIKLSFRSQSDFDVNMFAKKYFNGGGHKNAAGGFLNYRNMDKALNYIKTCFE
tara:strand:- start:325 stop:1305 length:981 start_codon:yes stop_codon:yes gene_type:complete